MATFALEELDRARLYVADADGRNVRPKGTRIAATGGAPTLVGELAKSGVGTITLTADGRRVVFATSQNSDSIELRTLENVMAQRP